MFFVTAQRSFSCTHNSNTSGGKGFYFRGERLLLPGEKALDIFNWIFKIRTLKVLGSVEHKLVLDELQNLPGIVPQVDAPDLQVHIYRVYQTWSLYTG